MSKKVFITRPIPDIARQLLVEKGYSVESNTEDRILSHEELVTKLSTGNYDAVLSLLTDKIDVSIFENAPSVGIYANYASGFDNIDVAEARKRGIVVTNAPAEATPEAVAEHTMAVLFALATHIIQADAFVRGGKYIGWNPMNFIATDLQGKTIGLIGAGKIGEKVAQYAHAFGLQVIYTDIVQNAVLEKECNAQFFKTPEEVLAQSDIVSLHVPLLDSTRHLINAERLRLMKPTSFLINTARGPVIDESALVDALKQNIIAGAALDVFEAEPLLAPGLTELSNVILTPHIASASVKARHQMAETAAINIIDFFEGKTPQNKVS
jgi:glyoxylate reductase